MRALLIVLLVCFAIPGAGRAIAGQLVVLESTAPGFKVGQVIDSAKKLSLPAGTRLSVIGGDGTVRALKGPFSGAPGGSGGMADTSLVASLAKLIEDQGSESVSLGVTRAIDSTRPPVWGVDALRTGDHCVLAGSPSILWRHKSRKPAKLTIRNLADKSKVTVPWPAGASQVPWPTAMPLHDQGDYLLKVSTKLSAARLTLHVVPAGLPSDAHRAVWVAERGCRGQARALLAGLR